MVAVELNGLTGTRNILSFIILKRARVSECLDDLAYQQSLQPFPSPWCLLEQGTDRLDILAKML
jgi:hypothetical protein